MTVQVPGGDGDRVVDIARRHEAVNVARVRGTDADGREIALVLLHVSNAEVGPLLDALDVVPELRISMLPSGALALHPPAGEAADQMTDVAPRSPLEVYVAGLQSIGAWSGFLGYAAAGGAVVWLALTTSTVSLLVGAMLIAPFAGPAINTAVATARGDLRLLWRSVLRYGAALLVTAAVAALLSLAFGQAVATELMVSVATISAAAVLLPLTAGAAGALHLCQGEQSSLVSGAAAGMLIAASLAPPAGLVGIATVTGDHAMLAPAAFLLALQLVGINLAGAIVFRLFGLTPSGARYQRGGRGVRLASVLGTLAALGALMAWQFGSASPALQGATIEHRMRDAVLAALSADGQVAVIESSLRFTRASNPGRRTLLIVLYVQRDADAPLSGDALKDHVSTVARRAVTSREPTVTPVAAVTEVSR